MPRAKNTQVFERDPFDWYVEGREVTAFLLARESFDGGIWDPCCGQGNIVLEAIDQGLGNSIGSDVVDRAASPAWFGGTADFFRTSWRRAPRPHIVSNPPYFKAKGAEAFIRHALAIPGVRKVAVFANSKFLFGGRRARGLFAEHPPKAIYFVTPRPSCPPGEWLLAGNKAGGGVENFVWIVWDADAPASTGASW